MSGILSDRAVWGYADSDASETYQGDYATRAEAIAAAREHEAGWIVEGRWVSPGGVAAQAGHFYHILERMSECEEVQLEDHDFATLPGAEEALERLLQAWAEVYVKADWWMATGTPEPVPAEVDAE